jgi:hypothetical protein
MLFIIIVLEDGSNKEVSALLTTPLGSTTNTENDILCLI